MIAPRIGPGLRRTLRSRKNTSFQYKAQVSLAKCED